MPQAAFSGAPARIAWSAWSKSSRKLNAANADANDREEVRDRATAAQAGPKSPPTLKMRQQEVDQAQRHDAEEGPDEEAGELRRDADSAGLVDDEHADEHAEGAHDRLADQRTGADVAVDYEVRDDERERAEEQALENGVRQHDRRLVLLAAERRDENHREAADHADQHSGMARAEVLPDEEVGNCRDGRQHGQCDAGLGDDVIDGQRTRNPRLLLVGVLRHIGLSLYLLCTVAGGSGTELCITTLRLWQGSKYRVAGLPHRRFLSCALVRLVAEHTLNDWSPGFGSRRNLPGLSQETLPGAAQMGATF